MRIIAGRWKGRKISVPSGTEIRPTGDRVREAWMSILQPILFDASVLDLCAGTGALGLECLSRGAASCHFVDRSARALVKLEETLTAFGGHGGVRMVRDDALRFVERLSEGTYDIALADPPYSSDIALQLVELWVKVPFANVFAVEHSSTVVLPAAGETRRYGSSSLTFFRAQS